MAIHLGSCLLCVCIAQAHWLIKLLCPPSWCVLASLSPCHSPHSIRNHPFGKPSLVLQLQSCVFPSLCIEQPLIECLVLWALSWALRVTGHAPQSWWLFVHLHCASVSPQAGTSLASSSSQLCVFAKSRYDGASFLSFSPPPFLCLSSTSPRSQKERRRKEKFIITRLGRSDFIPSTLCSTWGLFEHSV